MNEVCPKYHVPVMLMQSVDAMNIGNGNYVDVTFGGGGHTREILAKRRICLVLIRMLMP